MSLQKKANNKSPVNTPTVAKQNNTIDKASQEALAHFAAIIHSSSDPIISKTLEGIITSWNEAAERVFGYSPEEVIGRSITLLIPEDRLTEEPLILERLKKGEIVQHFETKRITKNKKVLDISLTISPVKDSEGNIIGASKIARDITTQKLLLQSLHESEERLRMVSEATHLGTWEYHPFTQKLIWSKECKNIYGMPGDFEPSNEFVSAQTYPEDRDSVDTEVKKAYDPLGDGLFDREYRIIRGNDKQIRWLKVQGKVFFNSQREPERFLGNMIDITEEKMSRQMVLESEERLRMAVQSTKLGTWEFLPVTGSLTWSEECRKIYDAPADMPIDYEFFSTHIHPEDAEFAQQSIANAMDPSGTGYYDIQYRILRYSDKQPRWIRAQGKVYFNSLQQAERFIGTVLDISENKLREQELMDSLELFSTMADNVPVMIWMSGTDKFCDYFNKTWLEFTGRTIKQESNEGWLENVHPEDVQKCITTYQQSFMQQKAFYIEYRLKRHDGKYRWIADNSVTRLDPYGNFVGFISACIDIDDQKNSREMIMQSELLLKTISNAAPVGLWMTDTTALNTFVNDTWINWTGMPFEKHLGRGWLDKVLEEDKIDAPEKFRDSVSKKEKYSTEFRIIRADGQLRYCLTEGSPYYDIDGKFAGYAGSVTDITELKNMEQRKDDFIRMASHELKTPITSIKGYVQLLLNIYTETNENELQKSGAMVKSALTTVNKQVSKLTRLISELLDLSKIESGKLELQQSNFMLNDLIEETIQEARLTTSRHTINVTKEFNGKIYADKDRVSQVLLNLLTNAIKYSPGDTDINVFVKGEGQAVSITVQDHGIGIDEKDQALIFQRFYRAEGKNEQTYPGFGIGLFIANEITERHGGTITVKSEKDKGSLFTVTLPLG